jgi:hypothetical protein
MNRGENRVRRRSNHFRETAAGTLPAPAPEGIMPKSATDIMQEIVFSALLDSIAAFKDAAKGVPNVLVRELNTVHPNTTLEDMPAEVRAAIAASVRDAFARLRKEGYAVAGAETVPSRPPARPAGAPPRSGGPGRSGGDRPRRPEGDRPRRPDGDRPRRPGGGGPKGPPKPRG